MSSRKRHSPQLNELLGAGLRSHQAGRLMEAKSLYEQALALDARHPDALHLLGVVALQSGDAGRAASLIERALKQQPDNPGFHANLARAHLARERHAEAHTAFRRAAALDPREPQFALGAANSLALAGKAADAERELRALAARHPAFALAWYNLGNALRDQGRHEESIESFRHAVALDPGLAEAHSNLGNALRVLGRTDEALAAYRECIARQPDALAGYRNLASLLSDRGRFPEAIAVCEEGIARQPAAAELHFALGSACTLHGRPLAALKAFRTAARLAPDDARTAAALGNALCQIGRSDEGMHWLRRALALQPDLPDLRHAMAGACLAAGDLQQGWAEYEARPARRGFLAAAPDFTPLRTLPEDVAGRQILLLREQGLGDELFFLRYTAPLKARGARIACVPDHRLAGLLRRVPFIDDVPAGDSAAPQDSATLLVGDLPHALGWLPSSPSGLETAARDSYAGPPRLARQVRVFQPELPPPLPLAPLPAELQRARDRLAAAGTPPYIGVTWRGGVAPVEQQGASRVLHKEVPLDALGAALRGTIGTVLVLQRLPRPGELEALAASLGRPVHDFTALNEDLEAMLALLAVIDGYVGVSNTNMHLRAGVGRTAHVLVPQPGEWRWMATGAESPWFPGFPIYRQGADGAWSAALERLERDLRDRFGGRPE